MQSILFICTGNVFRSLVAEHALKALIGSDVGYTVNSAGIEALPQAVHPLIRERLRLKGCDLVTHEPRKLSRDLLDKTTLPVAMGFNHQDFLRETFNREVRLFTELAIGSQGVTSVRAVRYRLYFYCHAGVCHRSSRTGTTWSHTAGLT
jgi:protein-tyrosine phosphatase